MQREEGKVENTGVLIGLIKNLDVWGDKKVTLIWLR